MFARVEFGPDELQRKEQSLHGINAAHDVASDRAGPLDLVPTFPVRTIRSSLRQKIRVSMAITPDADLALKRRSATTLSVSIVLLDISGV